MATETAGARRTGKTDTRAIRLTIPAKAEYITLGRLALTGLSRQLRAALLIGSIDVLDGAPTRFSNAGSCHNSEGISSITPTFTARGGSRPSCAARANSFSSSRRASSSSATSAIIGNLT